MRLLCVDVGNTSTTLGLYEDGAVSRVSRVAGGVRANPEACADLARLVSLGGVEGVSSVEESGENFLVQSAADVSDAVARALLTRNFHLTYLRQCGSDLDEIYSRYFVKAGEQHEGSRSGSIFRHLRGEAKA